MSCATRTASWLIARGISLKVIAELLGHSGIAVTADIYGHLFGPSQEVADVLAELLPSYDATRSA
jgi:site-specific recombinase XerD